MAYDPAVITFFMSREYAGPVIYTIIRRDIRRVGGRAEDIPARPGNK